MEEVRALPQCEVLQRGLSAHALADAQAVLCGGGSFSKLGNGGG